MRGTKLNNVLLTCCQGERVDYGVLCNGVIEVFRQDAGTADPFSSER